MGIKSSGASIPAGIEAPYHGGVVPVGWLLMFGQVLSIADYPRLFAAIGSVHGGDGVTTFGIPDSRGRATIGKDDMGGTPANRVTTGGSGLNGAALGAVGGGENVTLTTAQEPSHTHAQNAHSHSFGVGTSTISNAGLITKTSTTAGSNSTDGQTATNQNTGGSGAHSNIPPAIVANKIIKV